MNVKYFQWCFLNHLLAHGVKEQAAMKKQACTTSQMGKIPTEANCVLHSLKVTECYKIHKHTIGKSESIMCEKNGIGLYMYIQLIMKNV